MRRWAPWLLAFIAWNGAFDLQVRWAGEAFTAVQIESWRQHRTPALLRDTYTPQVRAAAWRSTAAAGALLVLGLAINRRGARAPHR